MQAGSIYCFGPYQLDTGARRLMRDDELIALSDRHFDVLHLLVARAGTVVSKDLLIEAAWQDVAVTDNSLEQVISTLRRTLGHATDGASYIETLARRGYRFGVPVTRRAGRSSSEALEALLAPHCAFVEGRAALERLEPDAVVRARAVFEEIVRLQPDYAPGHIGLANALALIVESHRADAAPSRETLATAAHHAAEACRLDPSYAEAWATFGLIFHQSRESARAVAAARRAVELDPDNWRHHVRLSYVSWGEERLQAAHRALKLLPELPLAHWLAATVYVARQALSEAELELTTGAAAQDRQHEGTRFRTAGVHLLLGLVRLAAGDEAAALLEFDRELAGGAVASIYTREACANAWCAIGAVRFGQEQTAAALLAFDSASKVVPGHVASAVARAAIDGDAAARTDLDKRLQQFQAQGAVVESALAEAMFDTLTGRPDRAARLVYDALEHAPAGNAGWVIPVDPLLSVNAHRELWEPALTLLRSRAA